MRSKKPFTILFDANSLIAQPTGVGYYTAGLIASLATADPKVQLVGYYYNFMGRKAPPVTPQAPNISYRPIYHLPGPVVNLLRRFGIEIPVEILTGIKADFVLYPNFLGQPSLFKTPNAPIIHDLMYHDHPEWGSDKNIRDLTRFVPATLKRASFIITMSNFTTERLVNAYHVASERIITSFIPPVNVTSLTDAQAKEIITQQGISKPYMLFVATLEPRKNLVNLLEAYTLLPESIRAQYSLILAGKLDWKYQETKAKMESLQAQSYDIPHLGYVDNDTRAALYQHARLMVMTSHYEGFGMQTLEAMQYGIPCAVSDIPVFHEVGGDLVSYFNQNDPADIARVVGEQLAAAPPDPVTLQGYVSSQPDWKQVGQSVLERIRQAAGRS